VIVHDRFQVVWKAAISAASAFIIVFVGTRDWYIDVIIPVCATLFMEATECMIKLVDNGCRIVPAPTEG